VTRDRTGTTVHIGLHDAATGERRWTAGYSVPAAPPPPPPPDGPGGGPPPGGPPPGGPGGPGGPGVDDAWQRPEGLIGPDLVALRDDQEIRVLRVSDGTTVWHRSWPMPVATIARAGDLLLIGADRLVALDIATAAQRWEAPLRGARIAVAAEGRTIVAVTQGYISGLDLTGRQRWRAELPEPVRWALPDRLTVDGRAAFATFRPEGGRPGPLDIDVVAFALDT
jgi:hypothetical protein